MKQNQESNIFLKITSILKQSWFIGLIILFILIQNISENVNTKSPLPPPSISTQKENISQTSSISLPTGTVIKKRSAHLQGVGELTIKNGTNYDALAKLIIDGTSVMTVYIKSNTNYTIKNISDGVYWLAFVQGTDWNSTDQKFNRDLHYQAFDDTFDFTTSSTESSVWEVTLNEVVGGTASTSEVDPDQFSQY